MFEQNLKVGLYDIAYMNPYHHIIANKEQGYDAVMRSGAKKLKGIVVVHKDERKESLNDLKKAQVAFPSPNALGASLLVRSKFKREGIKISPKYVKTHKSVYIHVAKKLILAGGGESENGI